MEETLIPLNDNSAKAAKSPSRSNSFGSDKDISLHEDGEDNTLDYRIHAKHGQNAKTLSLWHDISLSHIDADTGKQTEYYNFVCEIPKFTRYERERDQNISRKKSIFVDEINRIPFHLVLDRSDIVFQSRDAK